MSAIPEILQRDRAIGRACDDVTSGAVRAVRTDTQLIDVVLAGDETAFEALFDRHKRAVARTASRYFQRPDQIEEIIQISFTKAYFELARFRGANDLSFPAWLVRIAANACVDLLRSKKRRPEDLACDLAQGDQDPLASLAQVGSSESGESSLVNRDLAAKLLARLGDEDRALLQMLYVEDMSVSEIGQLLGWSRSKVKIRAWRARNSLRKTLKSYL